MDVFLFISVTAVSRSDYRLWQGKVPDIAVLITWHAFKRQVSQGRSVAFPETLLRGWAEALRSLKC